MTCARLLKLKHVQYMCIFFILYLIFHICGKSRMERTNKSKKKTNHIYNPPPVRLECISLVLLGLPCYHNGSHTSECKHLYSNQCSRYHSVSKVFLCHIICLLSESFIRDLLGILLSLTIQ